MNSIELVLRLHQHRRWVNGLLLGVAAKLTDEQLHQSFPIGQGSVWRSLTHLYAAEYVWLAALLGDDNPLAPGDAPGKLPGNQEGQDAMESVSDLQSHWLHLEERWESYLGSLQVANLTEQVAKKNSRSGQLHHTQRSDVLLHVCTHAQYTTAQAINMMRQLGVEPLPDPMLITMARQES